VAPIVDGRYLRAETQKAALAAAAGLPLGAAQSTEKVKLEAAAGLSAEAGKS
jgi:NAD(P)H-quinone oxidoreductase subunit K